MELGDLTEIGLIREDIRAIEREDSNTLYRIMARINYARGVLHVRKLDVFLKDVLTMDQIKEMYQKMGVELIQY